MLIIRTVFLDSSVVASKNSLIMNFCAAKPPKARSRRAELTQAIGDDYATVERCAHDCAKKEII